jgi:hypothetical protein
MLLRIKDISYHEKIKFFTFSISYFIINIIQ